MSGQAEGAAGDQPDFHEMMHMAGFDEGFMLDASRFSIDGETTKVPTEVAVNINSRNSAISNERLIASAHRDLIKLTALSGLVTAVAFTKYGLDHSFVGEAVSQFRAALNNMLPKFHS